MANTNRKQPRRDETAPVDDQDVDLLFKRIAERGRKKRNKATMKQPQSEPKEQPDPVVEILRLAYRRGLAIQREQGKSKIPGAENTVTSAPSQFRGNTMNEQGALERIDSIITSFKHLEKAVARNDSRVIERYMQTIRLELKNLRRTIC